MNARILVITLGTMLMAANFVRAQGNPLIVIGEAGARDLANIPEDIDGDGLLATIVVDGTAKQVDAESEIAATRVSLHPNVENLGDGNYRLSYFNCEGISLDGVDFWEIHGGTLALMTTQAIIPVGELAVSPWGVLGGRDEHGQYTLDGGIRMETFDVTIVSCTGGPCALIARCCPNGSTEGCGPWSDRVEIPQDNWAVISCPGNQDVQYVKVPQWFNSLESL